MEILEWTFNFLVPFFKKIKCNTKLVVFLNTSVSVMKSKEKKALLLTAVVQDVFRILKT